MKLSGMRMVGLSLCQWQMLRRMVIRQNETTEWESWWQFQIWQITTRSILDIWSLINFHTHLSMRFLLMIHFYKWAAGESPCPSAIAGHRGHQDFHETIESQRSPRKAIFSQTKEKRAFHWNQSCSKLRNSCLKQDSSLDQGRRRRRNI